ncbi:MAG TPA: hypothetical protein VFS21_27670 [Roseiflexaceae bacterium]|nr:hypothetical protein [Roseiflexaceae bacterium]
MDGRRIDSASSFTLALIPVAVVINIVIGQLASGTPVYLDSIGTVLVGALLGPWWGGFTGLLSNAIWTLTGNPVPIYFSYVAAAIGVLAGFAGRFGAFHRESPRWLSTVVGGVFCFALALFLMSFLGSTTAPDGFVMLPNSADLLARQAPLFALAIVAGAVLGYFVIKNAGYAGVAGLLTGLVAGVISAPMAAWYFGGVTGGGTDLLVAVFRASGAGILQSTFAQGAVSDPFDKMTSFMLVWGIIQLLPRRLLLRFPTIRDAEEAREPARESVASR